MREEDKNIYKSKSLSYYVWQRLKRNGLGMFGLTIIVLSALVAILGYLLTPDSSPDANEQMLELSIKPPGFKVQMLQMKKNEEQEKSNLFSKMFFGETSAFKNIPVYNYRFEGANIICEEYTGSEPNNGEEIIYSIADVLYALNTNSPVELNGDGTQVEFYELNNSHKIKRSIAEMQTEIVQKNVITKKYIFGTDRAGRDMLSRLLIGTRISLSVGFISVFISIVIGVFMGAIAGYFRGWADDIIMWIINVMWSIPTLLLVIAITLVLGKGFWQVFVAIGLTMWVEIARLIRGQILSVREKEFVEAGRALGYTHWRLITKHVLPNVMGPVIVVSAANFASAILIEAGLSFLGIGAQPPTASWGAMINAHRGYILVKDSAYLALVPGIAIMIMVLAFVLLGNGLRDALDTKSIDEETLINIT